MNIAKNSSNFAKDRPIIASQYNFPDREINSLTCTNKLELIGVVGQSSDQPVTPKIYMGDVIWLDISMDDDAQRYAGTRCLTRVVILRYLK